MPRSSGTSKKMKQIRKNIAKSEKIPQYKVRESYIRGRLKTKVPFKGGNIFPGIKVRLRPGETVKDAYKRAKKWGKKSGKS